MKAATPGRGGVEWASEGINPALPRVATVARLIAAAGDAGTVVGVVRREAAALLDADLAEVELFDDAATVDAIAVAPTDAVRQGGLVLIDDLDRDRGAHPGLGLDRLMPGIASVASAPLRDGHGQTIGVLTFGWGRPQRFDGVLRSIVETLAELCGHTLSRSPNRAFELAHLCAALAAAATAADVAKLVADHGRDVLGAAHASLRVVDPDQQALESLLPVGLPPDVERKYRHVALDAAIPAADAIRRNAPIWLNDEAAYLADYADAARDASALGYCSTAALPLRSSAGDPIGVIGMAWNRVMAFDPAFRATMLTIADVTGQALERAILAERASRVARRHKAIAALAQRIAGERDLDSILGMLATEIGPIMEASCADVTLAEPGGPRVFRTPGADPGRVAEDMASAAASARLPMIDAAGRTFGSLGFRWRTTRHLDGDDIAALTTLTELAARTVERSRTETTTTLRAVALGRLTQRLATSMTTAQLAEALAATLPDLIGSHRVVMSAADDTVSVRSAAIAALAPPRTADDPPTVGPSAVVDAACTAFVEGRTLLFPDRAGLVAAHGELDAAACGDVEASAHLPLHDADGQPRGVLCVLWSVPRTFDVAMRSLLATVADLVGQTLERTRLYDSEHATVMALQRRLLGPPATVDGFDIAVHYEPGDGAVFMGGDWYDTVVRADGTLVVVVGDVAGHGVAAVASMAQLQYLIAGLIRTNRALHRIFTDVNGMLPPDELGYATAQIFQLDARRGRLGYQSAGHPWALVRRPDGRVDRLDGGTCPAIGLPYRPEPLAYTQFTPSTLLLAYTDGLVERPGRSIVEGIDRLAAALSEIPPDDDVEEMLRRLVSAVRDPHLGGDRLDDDVAAVLIRATPGTSRAHEGSQV